MCFGYAVAGGLSRPDVIITTGAAPGAMALVFGKLVGARTIWIDGLASADKLLASGRWSAFRMST